MFRPASTTRASALAACRRAGFTLTELLIVIAIIGVLASLIAVAAVNAMRAARQARIVLEIKNLASSVEKQRGEFGAYPPNAMNVPGGSGNGGLVVSDLERFARKAFPRINAQELEVFKALAGASAYSSSVVTQNTLTNGMTAAEAVPFWFGGFSSDPQFPISGPGGPSYLAANGSEVFEDRNRANGYEFNVANLGPKKENGELDYDNVRYLRYTINNNGVQQQRQLNLWNYRPENSQQPLVYFDASRYLPADYDMPAAQPSGGVPAIYAIKQYRTGYRATANGPGRKDIVFANNKKFQILHAGLDDAWGVEFADVGQQPNVTNPAQLLLFPDGPFLGEIADTLTNFTDGPIGDEQPQ
jgi:prepilin-type N-terminal cleavage/methylation domain-containing protein